MADIKKTTTSKTKKPKKELAKLSRWLHIYLSMVSFAIVLFFAFTGLTLNHPSWFGGDKQVDVKNSGQLNVKWVNMPDTGKVAKLEIVEFIRNKYGVRGAVTEFKTDDYEVAVTFKGPAYSCDVFIDRESGKYEITEIKMELMALMNDLHKGRDSGKGWAWVIDVSAVFLIIISLTGLILLLFIKKKRIPGVVTAIAGVVLSYLLYILLVP